MRRTRQLGRYHITDRIAFGGMAELFRGFTFDLDGFRRDVAIKKVLPHFVEDKAFLDMLVDEFKLVSCLRHPNIAEVYELSDVDQSLLIVMEFVDGKDLRSTVERAKAQGVVLELDDIVYLMAKALDGLHHAHVARDANGEPLRIVHRDFSPSNILVGYDGIIKICDFGIAKAASNRVQTKTGIIKGKVKYMSPEQAHGRKLDWRSDIFSAGSVLYELITGTPAFLAPNEIDLIFAVREANPTPIPDLNPHVPGALVEIVMKSLAKSRSNRFQSALEFRDTLLDFLRDYNPQYRRNKLARFMKRVWAKEIDSELRAMEDYVVDPAVLTNDLGRNLIADALGPDAVFQRFQPVPNTLPPGARVSEAPQRTDSSPSSSSSSSSSHGKRRDVPAVAPSIPDPRRGPPPLPKRGTQDPRASTVQDPPISQARWRPSAAPSEDSAHPFVDGSEQKTLKRR